MSVGDELSGEVTLAGLTAAFDGEELEFGGAGHEFCECEAGLVVIGEGPLQFIDWCRASR